MVLQISSLQVWGTPEHEAHSFLLGQLHTDGLWCSQRLTSRDTTFDDFEVEIGPTGHRFDAKAQASASPLSGICERERVTET